MEWRLKRLPLWFEQAAKFGAVGLLNTAVDLGIYFSLTRWILVDPVLAKSISYSAGLLNSFFWNKSWTFRSTANTWTTIIPFILFNLSGLAINAGVMQLSLRVFNFPEIAALGMATACTLAWNFATSKLLVFRK